MIRINQIKLKPEQSISALENKIRRILRLNHETTFTYQVAKCSIDARKKPEIYYAYTVDVTGLAGEEKSIVKRTKNNQVSIVEPVKYRFPGSGEKPLRLRPVIIGTGPAGLFCGYMLAMHGYRPILLERGMDVERRSKAVEEFWEKGILNTECNVQFGEGGAGTFSDGKLNTLVKDKDGRNKEVLSIFVKEGAPENILYESKPHIGTDILIHVVKNMRKRIIEYGGEVCFDAKATDFLVENGRIKSVIVECKGQIPKELQPQRFKQEEQSRQAERFQQEERFKQEEQSRQEQKLQQEQQTQRPWQEQQTQQPIKQLRVDAEVVVLAIGHSARDTFEMLYNRQVPMEAKSFAVGLRAEHKQKLINASQYGMETPDNLPPASYKLTAQTKENRGVYSFCMCPGGYVVNASSEEGRIAVNGMSYSRRDGENANSAIIVSVTPEDYGSSHPLSGVAFQRELEQKAYRVGGGKVPVEYYGDFKKHVMQDSQSDTFQDSYRAIPQYAHSSFKPCIKGGWQYAAVHRILPHSLNRAFIEGMERFQQMIPGFAAEDTILSGVESRTSSPVRIQRDETGQSQIRGLYPCGEGAGYAGGITSAAMDGIRIAELIAMEYDTNNDK